MKRSILIAGFSLSVLLASGMAFTARQAQPQPTDTPIRLLSEPARGTPRSIALDYLRRNADAMRLSTADLKGAIVRDEYRTRHNGVTHVYLAQRANGLEIVNALITAAVDQQGRVVTAVSRFSQDAERNAPAATPKVPADQALQAASSHLGLGHAAPEPVKRQEAAAKDAPQVFRTAVSQDDVPVRLIYYQADDGALRLAWDMVLRPQNNRHWWNAWVDATTGEFIDAHDWVGRLGQQQAASPPPAHPAAQATPPVSQPARPATQARQAVRPQYRVFALPRENPYDGERTMESGPLVATASPYGWHDVSGKPGVDFTDTRGNNVVVRSATGAQRADGGKQLVFDFPLNLDAPPSGYTAAAMVNTFYWMNVLHDLHYAYGFDEVAGNFQQNNYGRGGKGADAIQAIAQAGEMIGFATPPDGMPARSRLFVATPITALIDVKHSVSLRDGGQSREFPAAGAFFGPILNVSGARARLVVARGADARNAPHPSGPAGLQARLGTDPFDGCEGFVNAADVRGQIAIVNSGGACSVVDKVRNAQRAGAAGVIVVGSEQEELRTMGSHDAGDDVTIPSVMVSRSAGEALRAAAARGGEVTLASDNARTPRDADLDTGVIAHEYGHGVVNRLVGGPSAAGCMQASQSAGITEGTADFWALALTTKRDHTRATPRSISAYVFFQPQNGPGVRGMHYTTDMSANSVTLKDLRQLASSPDMPHGMEGLWNNTMVAHAGGTIWATALWEVYWNLVDTHGYDADLVEGRGGNNVMLRLVMDGLKLMPCNPTFSEARDAILRADLASHKGANQCDIWRGFAKRGFGVDARDGGRAAALTVEDGMGVPPACSR